MKRRMRSSSARTTWFLAAGLTVLSCGWYTGVGPARFNEYMTPKVKRQASFDMSCPEAQLTVAPLDASSFGVTGCGRRMSYVPRSNVCSPNQVEANLDQACDGLVANVISAEPPATTAP